jgi:hypothetical protein
VHEAPAVQPAQLVDERTNSAGDAA